MGLKHHNVIGSENYRTVNFNGRRETLGRVVIVAGEVKGQMVKEDLQSNLKRYDGLRDL